MFCIAPLVAAVVLVFFGYFALWSAGQANTPKGIAQFGRILAIVLFVFAGIVLFAGASMRSRCGGPRMMGMMGKAHSFDMRGGPAAMQGRGHMFKFKNMNYAEEPCDTEETTAAPAPEKGKR